MQPNFQGIYPYLVTPMRSDGSVNEQVLSALVEHLIQSGVHGLTALGSTGEFAYLNRSQRRTVVQTVARAAHGRVPMIAGVCHAATREAADQAREYEALGAAGILAVMDAYFPVDDSQIIAYFKGIAQSVSCPVVLYTNPNFSRVDLSIVALEKLCEVPNILYLKDASGRTGRLLSIMNRLGNRISIFSASADVPLFVMMIGGVGWMAGPACLIPRQSVRLYDLALQRKWDEAMALQRVLWDVNRVFKRYNLAACIKAGLRLQGFDVGDPVAPLSPLQAEAIEEIRAVLSHVDGAAGKPGTG